MSCQHLWQNPHLDRRSPVAGDQREKKKKGMFASVFKQCSERLVMNSLISSLQQSRGIRVKVLNGNLDQALSLIQRKMTSSRIERMIKQEQIHHIKNSEKRVLARKALYYKLQSQDLVRKLKSILIKKFRHIHLR